MSQRARGFTLVESLVTLAMVGSLLALGASSMADLFHGLRLQAMSGDLFQQLMLARSEAIKRNGRVVLCKSADGNSCAGSGAWEQGWILFQDRNNSGARDENEPVLHRLNALPPGWRLTANGPVGRYVSYGPMGGARMASSGAFQAGTFTLCRTSTERTEARQIIINAGGRPRVQKIWLNDCY
ncbi:GspH/FimT family pseudopilin [Ramlibacter sp. PS3R-8]|uniref:GspH/FimT family pseudopilin n=1 Tax=Ramlibacter sp. PS3R-8 TaxID=3133437 RepID=UPI0030B7DE66